MDLQFVVDVADVETYCVDRKAKLGRGSLVIVTLNEQFQQPRLVRRELVIYAFSGMKRVEYIYHATRDIGAPPCTASFRLSIKRAGCVFLSK